MGNHVQPAAHVAGPMPADRRSPPLRPTARARKFSCTGTAHISGPSTAPTSTCSTNASGVSAAQQSWVKGTSPNQLLDATQGPASASFILELGKSSLAGASGRVEQLAGGGGQKLTNRGNQARRRDRRAISGNHWRRCPGADHQNCRAAQGPWGVAASGGRRGNQRASGPWLESIFSMGPVASLGSPSTFCPDG